MISIHITLIIIIIMLTCTVNPCGVHQRHTTHITNNCISGRLLLYALPEVMLNIVFRGRHFFASILSLFDINYYCWQRRRHCKMKTSRHARKERDPVTKQYCVKRECENSLWLYLWGILYYMTTVSTKSLYVYIWNIGNLFMRNELKLTLLTSLST